MRLWSLICGIVITSSAAPCLAQHGGWKADYAEASTAAEKDGLPVLLHFHAWYCGPCQRMDRDVFPHADVQHALSTGLASVEIDVTKEPDLAARFDASTVPRDVVVFADAGHPTFRSSGIPQNVVKQRGSRKRKKSRRRMTSRFQSR